METIFCRITAGVWMSRSSLVWGPFSVVWGLALAMATVLLRQNQDKSDRYLFAFGTVLGGVYEYVCSAVTELLFGTVFWDYSKFKFNLGGRINLLYCFFWGIAAVLWMRYGYPLVLKLMKKVRSHIRPWMTAMLAVFMAVNMLTSALALARYDARTSGEAPNGQLEVFLDEHFDTPHGAHLPQRQKSDQGRINPIFPLALLPENRYNILWIKGSKGRTLVEKRVRCAAATVPAEMPDAAPDA